MNTLFSLVKDHGTMVQITLFLVVITAVWLAELSMMLVSVKEKWQHSTTNLLFIGSALPIQLSLTLVVIYTSGWTSLHHWGLLNLLPFSGHTLAKYILGFILLDLLEYLYHVTMHKVSPFWSFHQIHHSDEHIDVSTTLREHPCETIIRVSFLTLWVFISGASIGLLLFRQTIQTITNLTSHSSYRLPRKLERLCSLLFITPGLHHVHHHKELPYTDRNYGDVLSIWDRIFGTYAEMDPAEIRFGVDSYRDQSTNDFSCLIKYPFLKKEQDNYLQIPLAARRIQKR